MELFTIIRLTLVGIIYAKIASILLYIFLNHLILYLFMFNIIICNLQTIGQAVGDWYFDRNSFHEIYTQNDLPRNCTSSLPEKSFNKVCLDALHDI